MEQLEEVSRNIVTDSLVPTLFFAGFITWSQPIFNWSWFPICISPSCWNTPGFMLWLIIYSNPSAGSKTSCYCSRFHQNKPTCIPTPSNTETQLVSNPSDADGLTFHVRNVGVTHSGECLSEVGDIFNPKITNNGKNQPIIEEIWTQS